MDLTEADVLKAAQDYDSGVKTDVADNESQAIDGSGLDQPAADVGSETEASLDPAKDSEAESKSNEGEQAKDKQKQNESSKKQESKYAKEQERRSKTWAEINATKEELKKAKEELERERSEWQKSRQEAEASQTSAYRDKNGFTAEEYESAAKTFDAQGEDTLAKQARQAAEEARKAAQQAKTTADQEKFTKTWTDNFNKAVEKHDWLKDQNSEKYKRAVDLLGRYKVLTMTPDGITHAVELVELQDQANSSAKLKEEVDSLKKELETLRKKTSIGGGKPTTGSKAEKPFEKMSLKEQEYQLSKLAREFDRSAD